MEEKLVTLAILTYSKAQILKNVLENEGIEACIHNVNSPARGFRRRAASPAAIRQPPSPE